MDEYITRNNAISAVCFGCNQQFSDEPCEPSDCTIRQSIMALPTADVVPREEVAREIFEMIWAIVDLHSKGDISLAYMRGMLIDFEKKYMEGE